MLYRWEGKPYRSKHLDVAEIEVEELLEIRVSHEPDGGPVIFSRETIDGQPLWQTEGFEDRGQLEDWFSREIEPGESETLFLIRFRVVEPALQNGDPVVVIDKKALTRGKEGLCESFKDGLWKVSFCEQWCGYYEPEQLEKQIS